MRALVQRVTAASVNVGGETVGEIASGLLVFLGVGSRDDESTARRVAEKVCGLRIFEDAAGKMNLSVNEVGGAVLAVSQFTLYGDVRRGRRPSFDRAAEPATAGRLYDAFCNAVADTGLRCERGIFRASMAVSLVNDGPVTLWVDSDDLDRPR